MDDKQRPKIVNDSRGNQCIKLVSSGGSQAVHHSAVLSHASGPIRKDLIIRCHLGSEQTQHESYSHTNCDPLFVTTERDS